MGKKKYGWKVRAFLLPFLACLVMCVVDGVFPFGDRCILHVDMYHQYCPFFTEFADKLKHGGNLQYSWRIGLGSDFVALYAYYLASPLNWLLLIWPKHWIIEFMTLAILVKIAVHYGLRNADGDIAEIDGMRALVFSTAYAMSGFVAAYSWNIMWMDVIALTPFVIWGLERLVKEGKSSLYYVTLAICILSNYYISIMLCMFLVIYFGWLFFGIRKGRAVAFGRFALYSLLAGGTGAVLMLPEMLIFG